jgi:hypothetical protein
MQGSPSIIEAGQRQWKGGKERDGRESTRLGGKEMRVCKERQGNPESENDLDRGSALLGILTPPPPPRPGRSSYSCASLSKESDWTSHASGLSHRDRDSEDAWFRETRLRLGQLEASSSTPSPTTDTDTDTGTA